MGGIPASSYRGISGNTLRRMGHGEAVGSTTLNELCLILNCSVQDILRFDTAPEELEEIDLRRKEINRFRRKKSKKKLSSD